MRGRGTVVAGAADGARLPGRYVVNVRVPIQALGVAGPRHDGIGAEPPPGEGIVPPRRRRSGS